MNKPTEYRLIDLNVTWAIPECCNDIPKYTLAIKNAGSEDFWYRNFTGAAGRFNQEGTRTFNIDIHDIDLAMKMGSEGWNIRVQLDNKGNEHYLLPVAFSNEDYWEQPEVEVISNGNRTTWERNDWGKLDHVHIDHASLVIRPRYHNGSAPNPAIKAYISKLIVTITDHNSEIDAWLEDDDTEEMPFA